MTGPHERADVNPRATAAGKDQTGHGPQQHRPPPSIAQPAPQGLWARDGHYRGGGPSPAGGHGGFGSIAAAAPARVAGGRWPREVGKANDSARTRAIVSSRGWRKWLYEASFHTINVGESADETELRQLIGAVKSPVAGTHAVTVVGGKGGAGKTSVTTGLASMFADIRKKDPVLAADADPAQAADLPDRIAPDAHATFGDILAAKHLRRKADLQRYVGQNPESGLDVLAGQARGGVSRGDLDAQTYTRARERLDLYYNLLFTDTGIDFGHVVMPAVLKGTDSLVMVASAIPDGLAGAWRALNWLDDAGYDRLRPRMVVVINHIRVFDGRRDRIETARMVADMKEQFGSRVPRERIFELPYDRHIAEAGVLELEQLAAKTHREFLRIAAAVAAGFGSVP
jgi:MinD-like ATPase involved in chromosome partitioning or flagellar assembly